MGLGLSGARRLVDEFEITSVPGEGTTVARHQVGQMTEPGGPRHLQHRRVDLDPGRGAEHLRRRTPPRRRRWRARCGLADDQVEEVAVAASELASNLVKHARQGSVLLRAAAPRRVGRRRRARPSTSGPGTRDIAALSVDGIDHHRHARHRPGRRTPLRRPPRPALGPRGGHRRERRVLAAATAQAATGPHRPRRLRRADPPAAGRDRLRRRLRARGPCRRRTVMMADGLGHGPMAARASDTAVRAFRGQPCRTPAPPPRGPAPALCATPAARPWPSAHVDHASRTLTYAGIGNIAGRVVDATAQLAAGLPAGHRRAQRARGPRARRTPRARPVVGDAQRRADRPVEARGPARRPRPPRPSSCAPPCCAHAGERRDDAGVLALRTDGRRPDDPDGRRPAERQCTHRGGTTDRRPPCLVARAGGRDRRDVLLARHRATARRSTRRTRRCSGSPPAWARWPRTCWPAAGVSSCPPRPGRR